MGMVIFNILMAAIYVGIVSNCFIRIFPARYKTHITICFYILFAFCLSINTAFTKIPYVNIILNLFFINMSVFLFSGNIKIKLLLGNFLFIAFLLSEDIIFYLISFANSLAIETLVSDNYLYIICSIISRVINYGIQFVIICMAKRRNWPQLSFIDWITILTVLLGSTCLVHIVSEYMWFSQVAGIGQLVFYAVLIMINAAAFIFFLRLVHYYEARLQIVLENAHLEEQMRAYVNEYKINIERNQAVKRVRHDLKQICIGLKIDLENENADNALNTVREVIKDVGEHSGSSNSGSQVIDGIINHKAQVASENNITLLVDSHFPASLNLDSFDFSIILGNALDNAIEASRHCPETERKIHVAIRYEKGIMVILVKNKFVTQLQKTSDGDLLSTKADSISHGLGLKSIRKVVDKYDGFMKHTESDGNFEMKILLILDKSISDSLEEAV